MGKTKQWFFRGWVVSLLAVLSIVFFIACSVDDGMNNFDNGSVGTGSIGTTSQNNLRFSVGLRGESDVLPIESGQFAKRNGRWVISVEWLPKYQGRVSDLEIKAVGTYLPDEIKNASVATNVTLLVQGKNVYEPTEEQAVAIYDPILGGWVQEETKFAMISKADSALLVMMFSIALNNFARNNEATLQRPITLLVEFDEVVVGGYEPTTHTITWNTNGGSPAPAQTLVNHGGSIVAPETISKTGFVFGGWFPNAEFIGAAVVFPITDVTANTTLFAKWVEIPVLPSALRAEPVAASTNPSVPNVVGSWRDLDANYYLINVGHIRNAFVVAMMGPEHYDGTTPLEITRKNITTATVSNSMTKTISNSVGFSVSSTIKLGVDVALKGKLPFGEASVSQKFETSMTAGISRTKSEATTIGEIITATETEETARRWTIGNNGEARGHYRYALYAVSDVYLLISTSLDNQRLISEEIISYGRTGTYLPFFEFSADGEFDNSPEIGNEINLADGFYRNLPIPSVGRRLEHRKIDTTFNVGEHNYTFDKGFPASIEVYAVGAGGGGQRGDTWRTGFLCNANQQFGNGGSGGGGAAAHISFSVSQRTDFGLLIGAGGSGATGHTGVHSATSGACGGFSGQNGFNGGETRVVWTIDGVIDTLNVDFGKGGHSAGVAGSGGANPVKPRTISTANFFRSGGSAGNPGCTNYAGGNGCATGGGAPGSISGFTHTAGSGGAGGTGDRIGESGLGGLIRIVIEYPVIVEL